MTPLQVGDRIRRLSDGRVFEIVFINFKSRVPVFSSHPADGGWSGWGGAISQLVYGETFENVEPCTTCGAEFGHSTSCDKAETTGAI